MAFPGRRWKLLLLVLGTMTGVPETIAGETEIPRTVLRGPGQGQGDPLLLSLRIARAVKDGTGIARYKSLARQRRLKEKRAPGGKAERPRTVDIVTGRLPPAGR